MQGDQMSLRHNSPKFCQNQYIIYTLPKYPKFSATSVISIKLPKANDSPLGENSPNLVTLVACMSYCREEKETKNFPNLPKIAKICICREIHGGHTSLCSANPELVVCSLEYVKLHIIGNIAHGNTCKLFVRKRGA
jgi:hypothetical protein